jgi:predicted 3-demethylubiquinone-9 3-methyltransferase (glyoxalase superfamily)
MPQRITPFLMFQGGVAEEAMTFYASLFEDARIVEVSRYGSGAPGPEGTVQLARLSLAGQEVLCSDSPVAHDFTFTPSLSLWVETASEAEIDRLFGALGEGGAALMPLDDYGFSARFGWVADRFGVTWQLNLAR